MNHSAQPSRPDDGPAPLREAATILLVRPADEGRSPGVEVLTLTRSTGLVFSAGATAFPGGRIESADRSPQEAAVRETFEETGILMALRSDGTPAAEELTAIPADAQARIEEQAELFIPFLQERGLVPDVASMHLLSRWVTPEGEPRRYDTSFYVAAVPAGQEPIQLSGESVSWQWLTPQRALEDFRAGRRFLMPPTWAQLRALTQASSVEQALALPAAPEPVTPCVASVKPRRITDFPGHEAYAEDAARFHALQPRPADRQ